MTSHALVLFDFLTSAPVWPWFALITGLLVGSFLNVVIYRLPIMLERQWQQSGKKTSGTFNLVVPPSACPSCQQRLKPWDNIPLLSYIWLRGRCRYCQGRVSLRYPLIELATGLLTLAVALVYPPGVTVLMIWLLCWFLLALSVIDGDKKLLPDCLTLPLLWIGLLVNSQGLLTSLESAVFGAVAGYLVLWSMYWVFYLVTGREGIGYGDFKLLAALGAWLGWQFLPVIILLSSLAGALVGVALILFCGRDRYSALPFGPWLAAAGLACVFYGESLMSLYSRLTLLQTAP